MTLLLDHPWWLASVLVGLASAALGWSLLRALPGGRRAVAVGSRLALFALLSLALSGAQLVRESDRLVVVGVVDVSGSVRAYADLGVDEGGIPITPVDAAVRMLSREDADRGDEDRVGLVAFDTTARIGAAPRAASLSDVATGAAGGSGTDLVGALRRAQALIPGDARGRLVLISDGVSTTGDPDAFTPTVPVDVVPLEYEIGREVLVEAVRAPTSAAPGAVVPIEVALRSTGGARGELGVLVDGEPIDLDADDPRTSLALSLSGGVETLTLRVPIDEGRVHRIRAIWDPIEGDTSAANNESSAITLSRDRGRVLLVAPSVGALDDADTIARVIERQGWTLERSLAREMPASMLELEPYDLVVLVNTPRDEVPRRAESALDGYVRTLGGGVVFVGGAQALGAGGWQSAGIEGLFPVELEVPDDVVRAHAAVVLVLDSSGSMSRPVLGSSRSQQQVANDSAAEAIEVLDESDMVGVVEFSDSSRVVVPIARNDDPRRTQRRIRSIRAGGGTNLGPALTLAEAQLGPVDAQTRHIVVLSDGRSRDAEALPAMARRLGERGIRVSTITIGDEADNATMRAIAERSGGVYYRVVNPSVLPRVFLKAVRVIRKPMVREGVITPVITDETSPMLSDLGAPPQLGGLVLTSFKSDDPRVMVPIVSGRGEPILAGHQVELGRVGVFTPDASRWSGAWIDSGTFDTLWEGLIAWAARTASASDGEVRTAIDGSDLVIEYDAVTDEGEPIDGARVVARIVAGDGVTRELELVQTGPGRYEGTARALGAGDHIVIVRPEVGGEPMLPTISAIHLDPRAELATLRSDRATLERLAARSGGRVLAPDGDASLFERSGLDPVRGYEPIWRALLVAALVVFLIDLAARRVAWDRWLAQARAETIAVTSGVRAERIGAVRERLGRDARGSGRGVPAPDGSVPGPGPERAAPGPDPAPEARGDPADDDEGGSLLAAKRRARAKYEQRRDDA